MNNRNSSIFKIIIWSIAAIILISILVSGTRSHSFGFNFFSAPKHNYLNTSNYSSVNNEIDASDITDIDINWVDGTINIEKYDGNTIKFYEECGKELDEKDLLYYYSNGTKLSIEYCSSKRIPISISGLNKNKSLTVLIPETIIEQFNDITIDTVSSDVNIKDINLKHIDIKNISGEISLENITANIIGIESVSSNISTDSTIINKKINIDTISGDVILTGSVSAIDFDSTSGDLNVTSSICPNQVDTDTVSGNITLSIPENDGFKYSFDKISGDLKCDFPINGNEYDGVYENGTSDFSFDTASGDVYISQNKI